MANFPSTFVESVTPLEPVMDGRGNAALERLRERGFSVATGMTPYYAGAIGIMGQQPHIRNKYCLRDATAARFATEEATRLWLQKGGGRAAFLLLEQVFDKDDEPAGTQLNGYAWTGVEACDELPEHPVTSAYRLGSSALGKGLAGDFIQVTVSGTHALYAPDEGIGLETWKSNHAARLYQKLGFELIAEKPGRRETLDPEELKYAVDGQVEDTRQFMAYPMELFNE